MDLAILLKGIFIGFSIAAPVGPIGILCIRRTLAEGRLVGLVTGLGAASADAIYGGVAAFGLTAVSGFLVNQQFWLRLMGGGFLCYLGLHTFLARPVQREAQIQGGGLLGSYASTFGLTLTNPMTILSFAAVFAGLGAISASSYPAAALLVFSVFLGSASWWLLLSGGIGLVRERFQTGWMCWVNRISGTMITAFGLYQLGSLFFLR